MIDHGPNSPHQGKYLSDLQATESLDQVALVYLDFLLGNTWRYRCYLYPHVLAAYRDLVGRVAR
jgi:hypothetical protein